MITGLDTVEGFDLEINAVTVQNESQRPNSSPRIPEEVADFHPREEAKSE
jgi:hypothetical protein